VEAFVAPAVYLITDRRATGGRPLTAVVAAALRGAARFRRPDGGLPLAVSLREKDLPTSELMALARELVELTGRAGAELYINGRLDVALTIGAAGIHLPGDGFVPEEVRALAPGLRVGVSTHTLGEVQAAARSGANFVVFGPIFSTPSKAGIIAPRGLDGLAAAVAETPALPVLALGGITSENAELCRKAGARGLACIRAIMRAPDPEFETAAFLARLLPPP
jgi:thiamine-phosphate pyrophosphorylase